ncbi:MAG: hypothetical protein V7K67_08945 [Nostoc sp.]|uniref:hypothetical protein n=1 Tax=Nostoc sp. TaxID=1180 RepID=UPI002FF8D0FD
MNQVYNREQLEALKRPQLWAICETQSKPKYPACVKCVEAILEKQPVKIADADLKIDFPKTEDNVTFTDIDGFYNFEVTVKGITIAELSHDAFNSSNPWYVSVSGVEVYRSTLYCEATDWVKSQYVAGALTLHQAQPVQVLTTREERAATIVVLEQHGDEFVVHNCENDHYYVVRPNHLELSERCECADCHYRSVKCKHQIAVENFLGQRLEQVILTCAVSLEELLDKPFDELSALEWERLKNYPAASESMELVAA